VGRHRYVGTLADASRRVLAEVERRKIAQVLKETAGNAGRSAEILQVSYKLFMQKVRDYGLA
jgi:DNA-binding NtrC family response regulator